MLPAFVASRVQATPMVHALADMFPAELLPTAWEEHYYAELNQARDALGAQLSPERQDKLVIRSYLDWQLEKCWVLISPLFFSYLRLPLLWKRYRAL